VTLTAKEQTLRTAIVTSLMPTAMARLRGVTRVDAFHADTALLCLVDREVVQLSKAPTVQLALVGNVLVLFASASLRGFPDMGQVLKDEGRAWRGVLHNTLREHVIAIPVESCLPSAESLQVTFGRLRSVGLQFATKAKIAAVHLFPVRGPKKLGLGGDSRTVQTQINSDHSLIFGQHWLKDTYHDTQPPFAFAVDEISRGYGMTCIASTEMRNRERDTYSACCGSKIDFLLCPVERVGMDIVANWAEHALRAFHWFELWEGLTQLFCLGNFLLVGSLMLLLPGESTSERFCCLDAGLDEMVTDQSRAGCFEVIVQGMMQLYAVLFLVLPAIGTHLIERGGELPKGLLQGCCLLRSGMQLYSDGSVHTKSLPYMPILPKLLPRGPHVACFMVTDQA
jgi:hypothetical protein